MYLYSLQLLHPRTFHLFTLTTYLLKSMLIIASHTHLKPLLTLNFNNHNSRFYAPQSLLAYQHSMSPRIRIIRFYKSIAFYPISIIEHWRFLILLPSMWLCLILQMKIACFFLGQPSPHWVGRKEKVVTSNNQPTTAMAFRSYNGWHSNYQTLNETHQNLKIVHFDQAMAQKATYTSRPAGRFRTCVASTSEASVLKWARCKRSSKVVCTDSTNSYSWNLKLTGKFKGTEREKLKFGSNLIQV